MEEVHSSVPETAEASWDSSLVRAALPEETSSLGDSRTSWTLDHRNGNDPRRRCGAGGTWNDAVHALATLARLSLMPRRMQPPPPRLNPMFLLEYLTILLGRDGAEKDSLRSISFPASVQFWHGVLKMRTVALRGTAPPSSYGHARAISRGRPRKQEIPLVPSIQAIPNLG